MAEPSSFASHVTSPPYPLPKRVRADLRIPVICADRSTLVGAGIFNPNDWPANSKAIVQSCWSEYSVLHHCVGQIDSMSRDAKGLCLRPIETLQKQWVKAKFDVGELDVFVQNPDLHMRIEAFFSGIKSLVGPLGQFF